MQQKTYLFLLFCAFFGCNIARAQVYKHREFNTTDGLSSTTIYHALQDSNGYLWFGTDAGATRFDGTKFQQYATQAGLSDNDVIHLAQGRGGKTLFLTYNGKFSYYQKGSFHNADNTPALREANIEQPIIAAFEQTNDVFWLGGKNGNLYQIKNKKRTHIATKPDGIHFFHEDKQGRLWIDGQFVLENGSLVKKQQPYSFKKSNAFFIPNNKTNEVVFMSDAGVVQMIDDSQVLLLPKEKIRDFDRLNFGYLLLDAAGNIWLTTIGDGVYLYSNPKKNPNEPPRHYLGNSKISTALQDHEGNIWFCLLGEGLYMLPSNYQSAVIYSYAHGLSSDRVNAVLNDGQNTIWLGMEDGQIDLLAQNGLITHQNIRFPIGQTAAYQAVFNLHQDKKGKIWCMTPNNLVQFSLQNKKWVQKMLVPPSKVSYKGWSFDDAGRAAIAHAKGVLWLTPNDELIPEKNIPNKPTYSVFLDSKKQLWVSTIEGLLRWDGTRLVNFKNYHPLLKNKIKSMAELPDHSLILAAEGFGLFLFRDTTLVQQIALNDSLPSTIFKRVRVTGTTIWCTGNHGLVRLEYEHGKVVFKNNYRTSEGLPSDEITDVFNDKKETLVATAKGLTILSKSATTDSLPAPRCFILNKEENSPFSLKNKAIYTNNSLSIYFEAVAFREPTEVSYRYRYHPAENWQYTKNTVIPLAQLQPGSYQFEVQTKHLSSVWGESDKIAFVVLPLWYQTWWFWSLIMGGLMLILGFIVKYYIQKQELAAKERLKSEKKSVELEQKALQGMMNPHFIFNVMNSVQYFLNNNNKESANRYLSQFAKMLRTNLEYSNKPTISLEEELRYLNLYLSLEKLRCGDKLNYVFEVDENLDTEYLYIPPMLLQPYIENAIWHGIMPKEAGGTIRIMANELKDDLLEIKIIDDGIGIENSKSAKVVGASKHHSLALSLTQDRLRIFNELTKKPYSVTINQITKEGGTEVTLLLSMMDKIG